MEKIKLKILGISSTQSQIGSFALVLGEENGNRRLPIIIGTYEAQAIALEIENIKPNRPMTHDLIVSIAKTFGLELEEVIISDLKEGIFYSRLIMRAENESLEIDARPSDAIAIAVRFKVPIYTYDFILQEAGIILKESEVGPSSEELQSKFSKEPYSGKPSEYTSKEEYIKFLNRKIKEAIQQENYEEAARLRDEISRLNSPSQS
ncbi:MAG: bifunctional nuclease family protein [Bacteroidia bacterium]|nr:bifunctional nuclease family protein [Bacteroidia bacterium]MDW8158566.1 bifunctional nuclease family protein [Bacteroidia bacterium]